MEAGFKYSICKEAHTPFNFIFQVNQNGICIFIVLMSSFWHNIVHMYSCKETITLDEWGKGLF